MRLSNQEFKAMNNAVRRFIQRTVEFPIFKSLGLTGEHRDILEIGCGSGYGAVLLNTLHPKSYVGIDLMPEQITLAQARNLANCEFMVRDATDLSCLASESKNLIVIFGVLHHIPPWRDVIVECARVLGQGGQLFLEEPQGALLDFCERHRRWDHPREAFFGLRELEDHLQSNGLTILQRRYVLGFGIYAAQKSPPDALDVQANHTSQDTTGTLMRR